MTSGNVAKWKQILLLLVVLQGKKKVLETDSKINFRNVEN